MSEKLVPKLRFSGFDDEWKAVKLNKVGDIVTGATPPTKNKSNFTNSGYLWVTPGDIDSKKFVSKTERNLSEEGLKNGRKLEPYSILVTCIGATIGKICMINEVGSCNQQLNAISPHENFYPDFIYYNIQKTAKNLILLAGNTATPILNKKSFGNLSYNFPSFDEQKKIALFIDKIDQKIELLEQKYQEYQDFKKYLMQQIFAQKLRFDFNDDWQDHTFKELLIEVNEKTTVNNQHEILSSTKEGIFTQKEYFANRNVASKDNTGYKILRKNQIVLSPQNLWMGNINVNTEFEIGIVSPSYKIYETTDLIEIDYFKHIIKLPRLIYEYKCASEQGASIVRRNLNKQLFDEITISIPSLKEQQKIGNMLTLIDKKITETSKQIDESKEFKKGLLQQMFV